MFFLQIEAPSTSAEDMQVEISVQEQMEVVDPQVEQPVDNPEETVEAESSDCQQHGQAPSETAEPEAAVSPQKEPMPGESSPVQPDPSTQTKVNLKSSPGLEPPQRRSTRRHPPHDKSPSPQQYGRKLRSSINAKEQLSPQLRSKKTKLPAGVDWQKEDRVEQPPSKKARGKRTSDSPNKAIRPASAPETGLFYIQ